MRYYLRQFINHKLPTIQNNRAYLFILSSCEKNIDSEKKLSDLVKNDLEIDGVVDISCFPFSKIAYNLSLHNSNSEGQSATTTNTLLLKSVQIKNFKGFGCYGEEDKGYKVDIHENKTIVFAPNGGGKTSFCEALEYKLTGKIKEAKRRKYDTDGEVRKYFSNGNTDYSILVENNEDNYFDNLSDENKDFYKNCFIEKNRIQEFAFLGSKDTNTKEKDVIATLFGLEELAELVGSRNFVLPNSFKAEELKQNNIQVKIANLEQANSNNITTKKIRLEDIEKLIANQCNLLNLARDLYSKDNIELEIEKIKSNINQLKINIGNIENQTIHEHTLEQVVEYANRLKELTENHREVTEYLSDKKDKINYTQLYLSIQKIADKDKCPACDTVVSSVTKNPFAKADEELQKLEEIIKNESELKSVIQEIKNVYDNSVIPFLGKIVKNLNVITLNNKNVSDKIEELREIIRDDKDNFDKKHKLCNEFYKYILSNNLELQKYFTEIANDKNKEVEITNRIKEKSDYLNKLQEKLTLIQNTNRSIIVYEEELKRIEENLLSYNSDSEKLKTELELENKFNEFISEIQNTYQEFYNDLQEFKAVKEKEQFENIENDATDYYRMINKHDSDSEAIEQINFVKEDKNYRIKLNLKNQEEQQDAFKCLSEGHTRVLGLALMFAIAKDKPFLVFDDVINTIDTEHRANIIDFLFEQEIFKKKQIIITTHDRLFWERFCFSSINQNYYSYVFDYDNNLGGIYSLPHDLSFVSKIEKAIKVYDIRQAMIYCRIWFETLVTNYCMHKELEITAKFSNRDKEKNNLIKISLGKMYRETKRFLTEESKTETLRIFDYIYMISYNWSGINESNHAIDETNLNYSHSKTSLEVQTIFENLKKLEYLFFPQKAVERLEQVNKQIGEKEEAVQKKATLLSNAGFTQNAEPKIVEEARNLHRKYEEELSKLELEKEFLETVIPTEIVDDSIENN